MWNQCPWGFRYSPGTTVFTTVCKCSNSLSNLKAWLGLINGAKESVEIAAMYTSLFDGKPYPQEGGDHGVNILKALLDARSRGVSVKIVEVGLPFLFLTGTDCPSLLS